MAHLSCVWFGQNVHTVSRCSLYMKRRRLTSDRIYSEIYCRRLISSHHIKLHMKWVEKFWHGAIRSYTGNGELPPCFIRCILLEARLMCFWLRTIWVLTFHMSLIGSFPIVLTRSMEILPLHEHHLYNWRLQDFHLKHIKLTSSEYKIGLFKPSQHFWDKLNDDSFRVRVEEFQVVSTQIKGENSQFLTPVSEHLGWIGQYCSNVLSWR